MRVLKIMLLLLVLAPGAALAERAAVVTLLTGRGTASTLDGDIRALRKGDEVRAGEVISTGANSYLNLKFTDGSFVLLRPNSRFQIEDYAWQGEDLSARKGKAPAPADTRAAAETAAHSPDAPAAPAATESAGRAFFRLLKGGFRAVTGLVARTDRSRYRVATPVATIGIRGTDYIVVLVDPAIANDPVLAASLPSGASSPEGGVVVGVIEGGVFVSNPLGQTAALDADQYLVTLPDGSIVQLPFQPRFLRVDPIPNPETCE